MWVRDSVHDTLSGNVVQSATQRSARYTCFTPEGNISSMTTPKPNRRSHVDIIYNGQVVFVSV